MQELTPSPELLKFAGYFSKNYLDLSPGGYYSDDKNYHISYFEMHPDFNFGRVLSRGGIQINKSSFDQPEIAVNFMFFLILWSTVKASDRSMKDVYADSITLNYYLTTRRKKRDIRLGYLDMLSGISNASATLRLQEIFKKTN